MRLLPDHPGAVAHPLLAPTRSRNTMDLKTINGGWDRRMTMSIRTSRQTGSNALYVSCTNAWHRGPFYEPWAATSSCSHTFCQHCIRQHHQTLCRDSQRDVENEPLPCPSCRTPNRLSTYSAAQPLIRNLVDSLKVYCPVKTRGCDWTGERESVEHHLAKECDWVWVGEFDGDERFEDPTPTGADIPIDLREEGLRRHKGSRCQCGARVMRRDWENHCNSGCSVIWQRCEHCKVWLQSQEAAESHKATCDAVPIECQHCAENMPRGYLETHELQDCPNIPVSCSMAHFGCSWKGPRGSLGLGEGICGPLERNCHNLTCPFLPLASYLQISNRRLQLLEAENASLKLDASRSKAAMEANEELLRSCVDALGTWCQRSGSVDERRARGAMPEVDSSARRISERGGREHSEDYLAGWPYDAEASFPASLEGQRASRAATSGPLPSSAHRGGESSRLERTINDLVNSISALSTQDATLTSLLHESRRESMYAGVEVARLAEEVASLRHGLHNVARHVQMRQSGWRGGGPSSGPGNGSVNGEEAKSSSAPLTSSSAPSQKVTGEGTLELGMPSLFEPGRGPGMGTLPFLPHGPALPHSPYYHSGYQSHGIPYPPSLPMPMPGVRRYWSGFEQTKL
ncbi:hypothetical protein BCV69DRAFT_145463 [Microstroma glucosiphilum]|uniref:RING-type domain-containing protein n=1 Tax=Pseudomicrostroma glucosiphilum TaxID=1684307 RepID=A0A316UCA9_9BASI|nr:hypothetical protein BCV69DRAFT_145463 [Pseudomicrostroma glucosiphilum]PWN22494.1 hypothetical protein BCV69DRAFT_145463 [Pseudomicrostroma glucosiphilum]